MIVRLIIILLVVLTATATSIAAPPERPRKTAVNSCEDCHNEVRDKFIGSVHHRNLIACTDCHGGDAKAPIKRAAHSPRMGFRGQQSADQIVVNCGNCHKEVLTFFRQGPHFQALQDLTTVTCVSCHGEHSVTSAGLSLFTSFCQKCNEPDTKEAALGLAMAERIKSSDETVHNLLAVLDRLLVRGLYAVDERTTLDNIQHISDSLPRLSHNISLPKLEAAWKPAEKQSSQLRAATENLWASLRTRQSALWPIWICTALFVGVILWKLKSN